MNAVRWLPRGRGQGPRGTVAALVAAMMIAAMGTATAGAAVPPPSETEVTPPRLGYTDGEVLFWRPGAGDWEAAQINMPLAEGDALATRDGKLELQIGGKSFVRAGDGTQLRLVSNEPGFVRFEVSSGYVVVDLRELRRGVTVQLDTPSGTITLAQDGYYRVDVGDATRLIVRRGGLATVRPVGGAVADVGTGEAIDISGTDVAQVAAVAAPPFDDWDRWNYDRAERYLATPRSYAVSDDIYGADELETNGTWRYVSTYGRVWVPNAVPAGWAPYTYGRWAYDPLYGWSWVDYAPWGWAPYHYGRWVYNGYWAWAPGPVIAAPIYAPALVAFFGVPGFSVGIGFPAVSWVALGWGEPLIPWWGPVGFIGRPCWWGWGGPRVVNNVVINNNTIVNANTVNVYRNMHVPGAVVGVPKNQFNTHSLDRVRLTNVNTSQLTPLHGKLPVAARGVTAANGGAPAKFRNPNFGGQQAGNGHGGAMPDFNRGGTAAAGSKLAAREQPFGTSGSPASLGNSKSRSGGAADALRGRGTTGPSANAAKLGAAPGSTNFQRSGQVPPPVPGGSKIFGNSPLGSSGSRGSAQGYGKPAANGAKNVASSSFDSLRNRGSGSSANSVGHAAPPALRSTNLQRGTSNPPPVPGGSKFGSPALNQRGGGNPPAVSGGSKFGSPNVNAARGSSNAGKPPTNMLRSSRAAGSQPPPVPHGSAKPGSATASFRGSPSGAQANRVGRSASAQDLRRAPSSAPRYSNVVRGDGKPAMPSLQHYRAAAPSTGVRSYSRGGGTIASGGIARGSSSFSRGGGGSFSGLSRAGGLSAGSGMSRGGMSNFSRSMGGGKMGR